MRVDQTAPRTIRGVIAQLDRIVRSAREGGDRIGYFAALYRTVTRRVLQGIRAGEFQDGARVERLDVIFANRYLSALRSFHGARQSDTPRSWLLAFETCTSWQPLIVQQLLLGINAHINFDLGVAAAEAAPGDQLPALHADFLTINAILGSMLDHVKRDIGEVSPWIGLLDTVDPSGEDATINFAMDRARDNGWSVATRLAALDQREWPAELDVVDRWTAVLGGLIRHPPGVVFNAGLAVIRARESNDVRRVIDVLSQV